MRKRARAPETKRCEREGCTRRAQLGHLMCADCWSKVPLALQRAVYRTWKALRQAEPGSIRDYSEACRAASDAVNSGLEVHHA